MRRRSGSGLSQTPVVLSDGHNNRRYLRSGHLFLGPYSSRVVESQEHLVQACVYVVPTPSPRACAHARASGGGAAMRRRPNRSSTGNAGGSAARVPGRTFLPPELGTAGSWTRQCGSCAQDDGWCLAEARPRHCGTNTPPVGVWLQPNPCLSAGPSSSAWRESGTISVRRSSRGVTNDQMIVPSRSMRNVPRWGAPFASLKTP
jgi:hypothetical protein